MKSNTTILESLSGCYDERFIDDQDIPMAGVVLSHMSNPPGFNQEKYFITPQAAMRSITDSEARKELRKQLRECNGLFIQLSVDLTPEGSSGLLWWSIRKAEFDRALNHR